MATTRRNNGGDQESRSTSSRKRKSPDAIALLKADHREVASWFEQFKKARSQQRKSELSELICRALKVHTQIEEEIFYPEFLDATEDRDLHHEAEVEHAGAKNLIAEIEQSAADDDYFDAKVKVLSEMIKHHVKEEEKKDGMFAKARASSMDLVEIGARLATRKQDLQLRSADSVRPDMQQTALPR